MNTEHRTSGCSAFCILHSAFCIRLQRSAFRIPRSTLAISFLLLALSSSRALGSRRSSEPDLQSVVREAQHPARDAYSATLALADSLYRRQEYEQALPVYRQANQLRPEEPAPRIGLGWTYLQLGYFYEAETTLRAALKSDPGTSFTKERKTMSDERFRTIRSGLNRVPPRYGFALTLSDMVGFGDGSFQNGALFLNFSHNDQTTLALGLQNIQRDTVNGFNGGLTFYRQLAFPWAMRFDFYGLSSFNRPRYWQVVYAPSLTRVINTTTLGLTFVGWDRLQVRGVQVNASRRLQEHLRLSANPAVNQAYGKFGWFIPLEVSWSPAVWLEARGGAAFGSIADHADLTVPTFYNQLERLTGQIRVSADLRVLRRFRIKCCLVGETYSNGTAQLLPSLALTAGL